MQAYSHSMATAVSSNCWKIVGELVNSDEIFSEWTATMLYYENFSVGLRRSSIAALIIYMVRQRASVPGTRGKAYPSHSIR